MKTTSTDRVNKLREQRKADGLTRVAFWLTPTQSAKVRAYVEKITKKPAKGA